MAGQGGVGREAVGARDSLAVAVMPAGPAAKDAERPARAKAIEPKIFSVLREAAGGPIPKDVKALAAEVTQPYKTQKEKAQALYAWITQNIQYDWEEWADIVQDRAGRGDPQDPESVLKRGKAICVGYAWLFENMARAIGLEAKPVIGSVRGYRGTLDDELVAKYKHAWNAVQLDGNWYLLDSTWGARQEGEGEADFRRRQADYFLPPAKQIIFDHLPDDPAMQFLPETVDESTFQTLPNVKPSFFRHGLRLGSPYGDTIQARGATQLVLYAPENVQLASTLTREGGDGAEERLAINTAGVRNAIAIAAPRSGRYVLRVYSRPEGGREPYECSVDYVVDVRN